MFYFLLDEGAGGNTNNEYMTWVLIGVLAVAVIGMFVFNMITKKKRQKDADDGKKFLRPGDKIKTVGGIVGTIVEINIISETEKELVIESGIGDNKTTLTVDINALYVIMKRGAESLAAIEKARQEREAAEAARLAEKQAGKPKTYNTDAKAKERADVFSESPAEAADTVITEETVSEDLSTKDE